jgi:hypothetical protein
MSSAAVAKPKYATHFAGREEEKLADEVQNTRL